jgi:hydroxymethylpyrimidine/phosphomethylpyrimidine kinase
VVVTGGHRESGVDLVFDGDALVELPGPRFAAGAAHGSGCTHSSALAAHLAHGWAAVDAARAARMVAGAAVRQGLRGLGAGTGPVDVLGVTARAPGVPPRTGLAPNIPIHGSGPLP